MGPFPLREPPRGEVEVVCAFPLRAPPPSGRGRPPSSDHHIATFWVVFSAVLTSRGTNLSKELICAYLRAKKQGVQLAVIFLCYYAISKLSTVKRTKPKTCLSTVHNTTPQWMLKFCVQDKIHYRYCQTTAKFFLYNYKTNTWVNRTQYSWWRLKVTNSQPFQN